MPSWRLKNVPQNPAKDLSEKEILSFPLKFIGHIFSPAHKPFGVIPQAHSLNLRSLFGICVAWGLRASFLAPGARGVNVSQGKEHQRPQEHPSAFSISFFPTNLFLSSPGGKAVTFFYWGGWEGKGDKMSWDKLEKDKVGTEQPQLLH